MYDDGAVRVYKVPGRDYGYIFACHHANGRRVLLGPSGDDGIEARGVSRIRVSGHLVAAVRWCACRQSYGPGTFITVTDLTASRTVQRIGKPGLTSVTDLVLGADGSVAWILVTRGSYTQPGGDYTVARQSPGGEEQVLDSGRQIDARGLVLADGQLYWRNAGENHTAPLAP